MVALGYAAEGGVAATPDGATTTNPPRIKDPDTPNVSTNRQLCMMEVQSTKSSLLDVRITRWLQGLGFILSVLLYLLYFALAAGYEKSWTKNASGPGVNMFEILAVFHFAAGCSFLALLFLSLFRRNFITLFLELLILLSLVLISFRTYEASLETWPAWIGEYSPALVYYSYTDFLLAFIVLALLILYVRSGFNQISNEPVQYQKL